MPPKPSFSRQRVLEAAFEVARRDGLTQITARTVADHLGSSTTPVYSFFQSMADLEAEVLVMARDRLIALAKEHYTESPFLNCGAGIVTFARDYALLYKALFLENDAHRVIRDELVETVERQMVKDPRYAAIDHPTRLGLINKMYTFTHGLASFACVGLLEDPSTEAIIETLDVMGAPIANETLELANDN